MKTKKGLIYKAALILVSCINVFNPLHASQFRQNEYESREKLPASCTIILLHMSFILEHDLIKTQQIADVTAQRNQAQIRAWISEQFFRRKKIFLKYLKSRQRISQKVTKTRISSKLHETFNSNKHQRMWKDLKLQAEKSMSTCHIKKERLVSKVTQALFHKNYKLALKSLFPHTHLMPSTQLLYEWIQRLYARSQRSPGKVTLDHLK
ncbi:MAG: hypothetical protein AB8G05_03510 [Oligoflexales bacterium]